MLCWQEIIEFYGQATKAKEETIVGQEKEQIEIAYVSAAINKLGDDVKASELQIELNKVASTNVTYNSDGTLNVLFNDTQHDYNVDNGKVEKVESLTNPYEEENWIMAWTCSNGIWSDTIQSGNVAEGEIVAKLYETGNRIKPDGFEFADITVTFNEDNEYKLVIEGTGIMPSLGTYDESGKPNAAFAWQVSLFMYMMGYSDTCIIPYVTEIIICDGITSIGDGAFLGATSLTTITMTNDITEIGNNSLSFTVNLSNIKLPYKLTTIRYAAFRQINLSNVIFPNNITEIDSIIFDDARNLSSITFLVDDTDDLNISSEAFVGSLSNITIYVKNEQVRKFIEENCHLPQGTTIEIL